MKRMKTWFGQLGKTQVIGVTGLVIALVLGVMIGSFYILGTPRITYEEAQAIALAQVGGGEVLHSQLSDDLFNKEYEFTISYNNAIYELDVSARSGVVNDFEVDR